MKGLTRTIAVLCAACLLLTTAAFADDSNSLKEDGFSTSYSYIYDYWGDVQICPDPYRVMTVIDTLSLGLENLNGKALNKPQGIYVRNHEEEGYGDVYIADSGNNRVIRIHFDGQEFTLGEVIDRLHYKEKEIPGQIRTLLSSAASLKSGCFRANSPINKAIKSIGKSTVVMNPQDIFVDKDDNIYIADYGNQRVVMVDKDLNRLKEFTKPANSSLGQFSSFLPSKIAVDDEGRLYVLAKNVKEGFMKYEKDETFVGYIGANTVKVDMADYIWKRYFMSKEQRQASTSNVPTEYENMYMDSKNFIYATTTVFKEYELKSDTAKPIRRLNGIGNDILIKNDRYPPIGDLDWKEGSLQYGPSKMMDITALDNDIYVALDGSRGRLFGYDEQGVMLWAFGTMGGTDGAFREAIGLEHLGNRLLVLDDLKNNVTVFSPTEYGQLIYDANEAYATGQYDESAELWKEVMKLNANYPLAFRGIGRSLMRDEKYQEAMEFFKMAHDQEDYGRAFKQYRKQWIDHNVWWIILILAALLIIPLIKGRIKRTKWEVMMHEHSKVRK